MRVLTVFVGALAALFGAVWMFMIWGLAHEGIEPDLDGFVSELEVWRLLIHEPSFVFGAFMTVGGVLLALFNPDVE